MKVEKDDFDDTVVALDTYNSDLNLVIDPSRYSAHPLTSEGFAFMWAGARATYGIAKGKICYEVKVIKHIDCPHLPADEPNPFVVRVGFSAESASMQLGEEPLSFGYGGTGKMSTSCQFKDYGQEFMEGDAITAFLDMDSYLVHIGFAKNGKFLGWAYKVNKSTLKGQPLFPHVLSKNCSFDVNFGQKEKPYFNLPEGFQDYTFVGCIPLDQRVRGVKAPERREDCEMIMMCGLPGAGKSTWAAEYSTKNPEKKYNVLGTNNIIDKMKVMGLPRKRNYHGRWEVLIKMATKCINKMFEIGSKLRRNYILDQTNVYPTAQRRKMKNFEGFRRKAVVVVPTDLEFRKRINKVEREEGKDVPDSAVLEMKANFKLPEVCDIFDEVLFTELERAEADRLVRQYNEEGRAATGPPQKRFHGSKDHSPARSPMQSGGYGSGNFRGRGGNHSGRGGPQGRGGAGDYGSREAFGRGGPGDFGGRNEFGGGRDDFAGGRGGFGGRDEFGRGDPGRGDYGRREEFGRDVPPGNFRDSGDYGVGRPPYNQGRGDFGGRREEFGGRGDFGRGDPAGRGEFGRGMASGNMRDNPEYSNVGGPPFSDYNRSATFGDYKGGMGDYPDSADVKPRMGGMRDSEASGYRGRQGDRFGQSDIERDTKPYDDFGKSGSSMGYSGPGSNDGSRGGYGGRGGSQGSDFGRRGGYGGRGGSQGSFGNRGGRGGYSGRGGSQGDSGEQGGYGGRGGGSGSYGKDEPSPYGGRSGSLGGSYGKDNVQGSSYDKDDQAGGYGSDGRGGYGSDSRSGYRSGDAQNTFKSASSGNRGGYGSSYSSRGSRGYEGSGSREGFDGDQQHGYRSDNSQGGYGSGAGSGYSSSDRGFAGGQNRGRGGNQGNNRSGAEKKRWSQDETQTSTQQSGQSSYSSYTSANTGSGTGTSGAQGYGSYSDDNYGQAAQQPWKGGSSSYSQNTEQMSGYNYQQATPASQVWDQTPAAFGQPGSAAQPQGEQAWGGQYYQQPQQAQYYGQQYGFPPGAQGYGGSYATK